MTKRLPLVSIIVRTKDRPKFLKLCLKSIASQYHHNIDVILINDGGCDLDINELKMILKNKSLIYIKNKTSQGRSKAANAGLKKITGQYFAFLDDDDEFLPHHIQDLVSILEKSDYQVAYSNVEEYKKTFQLETKSYKSELLICYAKDFNLHELLLYNYIPFNALLFHSQIIKNEQFDPKLDLYEDWDMLIRLALKYPFYHVDKVSAIYNKWSDDLQINNLSAIDTMRNNQNIVIQRYSSKIPANFLRNLWSEHLNNIKAISSLAELSEEKNQLLNTIQKRQVIIDERQVIINERQVTIDNMEKIIHSNEQLINNKDKDIQEYIQLLGKCKREVSETVAQNQRQMSHLKGQHCQQINPLTEQNKQLQLNKEQLRKQLNQREEEINQLQHSLHQVHISLAWRLINKFRKILAVIMPEGSYRKKIYFYTRVFFSKLLRFMLNKKKLLIEPTTHQQILNQTPTLAVAEDYNEQKQKIKVSNNTASVNDHIILISHDFHRAGAQINLIQGAKVLKDNYGKHIIFVALKDGDYRSEFEQVGDEVYNLYPQAHDIFSLNDEIEALFSSFKQRGIIDCICNTVLTGSVAPLLHKLGFNFVNLIHELPVTINIFNFHQAVLEIKQYSKTIVFSSQYAQDSYINNYAYDIDKTVVKAQGCYFSKHLFEQKSQARKQLREQLFLPQNARIIFTCGHLYNRKGPDVFLDLAKKILRDENTKHFHFVWLGGYEIQAFNWFQHDKQKMGINDHVHYIDFVDDPSLFYAGSDIFVLTAREDPFPTVVLESMNNGTPVIAFADAGGIPELLSDDCGVITAFLDTTAMKDAIYDLLADQNKYQTIVNNARQRVLQDYNFDTYMAFLLKLLQQQRVNKTQIQDSDQTMPLADIPTASARPYISKLLSANKKDSQYVDFIVHKKLDSQIKMLAFYLPQFHPITENDEWWGKGFTEWTNVSRAIPQFIDHYQPRLPGELGFYDLRLPEISLRQVELAKNYGIHGFCFYHYWFSGRRILEKPLDLMLNNKDFDMPFCLCWANENWSRRWDGSEDDILLEQKYLPEDDLEFIKDLAPYLKDPRYIKIDKKPLILIYRPDLLPDAKKSAIVWRNWCKENGIGEIYLCNVHSFDQLDPHCIGYNAAVEFPPNLFPLDYVNDKVQIINPNYAGKIYHYPQLVDISYHYKTPAYTRFRSVTPSWDNEARKPGRGTSFIHSSPDIYQKWLQHVGHFTQDTLKENEQFIFVNAWNEWAEGACLEPDNKFGYAYLQASYSVLSQFNKNKQQLIKQSTDKIKPQAAIAVILHLFYFDLWSEIKSYLENIACDFDLYVSIADTFTIDQVKILIADYPNIHLYSLENRGRDIYPFMTIFKQIKSFHYQAICKIHSKKSNHTTVGDSWRKNIFEELLGSNEKIKQIIQHFRANSSIGIIAPKNYLIRFYDCLGFDEELAAKNMFFVNQFIEQLATDILAEERFVTGSMFWFRPVVLIKLFELNFSIEDYPIEEGQIDGTIMHAIERVISICCRSSGYSYTDTDSI